MAVPSMNRPRGGAAGAYYKGKDHAVFGSYYNTTGEYYDGWSWTEAISGGLKWTPSSRQKIKKLR